MHWTRLGYVLVLVPQADVIPGSSVDQLGLGETQISI